MCVVCGCHETAPRADAPSATGAAQIEGTLRAAVGAHGDLHYGAGAARVSVPGLSQGRAIQIEADILGANNQVAARNRASFQAHGTRAFNLVSSPGSGKTTLLCATIERLRQHHPEVAIGVIEGDQETSFDADRIRATGAPAIQVNTGKGCHLDAPMVADAWAQMHGALLGDHHHHASRAHSHATGHAPRHDHHDDHHHDDHHHDHDHGHDHHHPHPEAGPLLFIENVGNLVCPALWDLGEEAKVAILSVTEGEDKPLKYPDMFAAARLMILNKIDLLPHVRFDVQRCIELARRVNPAIEVMQLSATTGEGMQAWQDWLLASHAHHG